MAADVKLMLEEYCWKDKNCRELEAIFKKEYEKKFGEDMTREFASSDLKFYLFERVLALPSDRLEIAMKILEINGDSTSSNEYEVEVDKLPIPMLYRLKAYIDSIPDREFCNERYFEQHRDPSKNRSLIMSRSEKTALSEKIDQLNDENKRNMFQLIRRYESVSPYTEQRKLSYYLANVRFSNIWKIKGYVELLDAQDGNKPMSEDEKSRLCDKILHMNAENMKRVCDRINELEPAAPTDINEIFFCFHSLKNVTLRAIERFVNSID
ncbi:unnamed protein product [Hymenolepis diminuta]|uniref:NET domain-containing protein n=1 Tax=Hymenolepis diminuta TaxID=6216 RepID=A0A564YNE6_HYMDI|nr:unnamed protein product [Hymenolepis diminuta]